MLARELDWPFMPEIHLFHNKKKCMEFARERFGEDIEVTMKKGEGAQTFYGNDLAIVLMRYEGDDAITEASLLVHEAYHIASLHYDYMGEEHPNEEFVAYGVQIASDALMRAQKKWKKHRK